MVAAQSRLLLVVPFRHASRSCFANLRRNYSTADVARWKKELLETKEVSYDEVDLFRAKQLQRTLPTRTTAPSLQQGDPLPLAHHLVLFQPETLHHALGEDGTSTEFNSPPPFVRRMWAGGVMDWSCGQSPICIGDKVQQTLEVSSVQEKAGMIFVDQLRELRTGATFSNLAVKERRTYVFRKLAEEEGMRAPKPAWSPPSQVDYSVTILPTSPLLFRFSALTFNGHRIHYDSEYTKTHEGHPAVVVHGPLTALLKVEICSNYLTSLGHGQHLTFFDYRAINPLYVDLPMIFKGSWIDRKAGTLLLWVEQNGVIGMTAKASVA